MIDRRPPSRDGDIYAASYSLGDVVQPHLSKYFHMMVKLEYEEVVSIRELTRTLDRATACQ